MNVITFPVKPNLRAEEADADYHAALAMLLRFKDQPEAMIQVLARCLVRIDELERAIDSTN